jgi:hypothetical protein
MVGVHDGVGVRELPGRAPDRGFGDGGAVWRPAGRSSHSPAAVLGMQYSTGQHIDAPSCGMLGGAVRSLNQLKSNRPDKVRNAHR